METEQNNTKPVNNRTNFSQKAGDIKRKLANNQKVAMASLMLLFSLGAGFAGGYVGSNSNNNSGGRSADVQRQIISNESELISQIARDVGPSVVSVNVESQVTRQTFFGDQAVRQQGAGTGFIISAEGIVITNRHVVP